MLAKDYFTSFWVVMVGLTRKALIESLLPQLKQPVTRAAEIGLLQLLYTNLEPTSRARKQPSDSYHAFFKRDQPCLLMRRGRKPSYAVRKHQRQWIIVKSEWINKPVACARVLFCLCAPRAELLRLHRG